LEKDLHSPSNKSLGDDSHQSISSRTTAATNASKDLLVYPFIAGVLMECAAKGLNCSSPHLLQLQRKSIMGKSFCYNTERRYRPVTTRSLVKGLHHQCLDAVNNKEAAKRRKSDTHLQHIALHCLG
jgi:hypothetical protein